MASVFSCECTSRLAEAVEVFNKETLKNNLLSNNCFEWIECVDITRIISEKIGNQILVASEKKFLWRNIEWSLLFGNKGSSDDLRFGYFLGFDKCKLSDVSSLPKINYQLSLVDQNSEPFMRGL